jgi:drug/metabolite transporter (DMT)-like permease
MAFALVAMVCFGAADLVYKRAAAEGVAARHFLMVQAWFFSPSVTLYAWSTGTLDFNAAAWWGALAGLTAFVAFYNFAESLRTGSVSRNAPIFRLNFTLTVALAVVILGEPLTASKIIGLALALAAVWLLLGESNPSAPAGKVGRASLVRVLIATVAMGFTNFFYKMGIHDGASPGTVLAAQAFVFMPLATLIVFVKDRSVRPPRAAWLTAPLAALALVVGFVLLLYGLARGPASTLVPVAQLGFVVTALMGVVLFGETLSVRKIVGLVVAVAALGALAIG